MTQQTVYQRVCAMNVAFGNPKGDPESPNWSRITKQCSNIKSELAELQTAIEAMRLEGIRDALCDIKVFAMGGLHFMGVENPLLKVSSVPSRFPILDTTTLLTLKGGLGLRFETLMEQLGHDRNSERYFDVGCLLIVLIADASVIQAMIGAYPDADMHAVIDGVLTRFCRDEDELEATKYKYHKLGVKYYVEGVFPEVCLKSTEDQGDEYPKGKFLKSVGYRLPIFPALL